MIRTFWPGAKSKNTNINNINGLTDHEKIAEFLNEHFSDTGERVQADINGNSSLNDFPFECQPPHFELNEISMADVAVAIDRLKSTQSCSINGVTTI